MAQHATSHFISEIIITDGAYQDEEDFKRSLLTICGGISRRYLFSAALSLGCRGSVK